MKVVGWMKTEAQQNMGTISVWVLKLFKNASRAHGKESRFQGYGLGVGRRSIVSPQTVVRAKQAAGLVVQQ